MDREKKLLFVVLAKNAIAEPMPVARPAPRVTEKAKSTALSKWGSSTNLKIDEKLTQVSLNNDLIFDVNLGLQEHVSKN
jgi:hypothetical protein